jgi:hypothetical protein
MQQTRDIAFRCVRRVRAHARRDSNWKETSTRASEMRVGIARARKRASSPDARVADLFVYVSVAHR